MSTIERETKETKISCTLRLDGRGTYSVDTPNRFLSHMVETLARYSGMSIELVASGDLEHHIVEDVAICLGQAFKAEFGGRPCKRIAHDVIPMDDALVLVAVDLVDRPYYEGELPIPIYDHFLRSFATEARINLHVQRFRGRDAHHLIEASFKATGRAIRDALTPRDSELSTKGVPKVK